MNQQTAVHIYNGFFDGAVAGTDAEGDVIYDDCASGSIMRHYGLMQLYSYQIKNERNKAPQEAAAWLRQLADDIEGDVRK